MTDGELLAIVDAQINDAGQFAGSDRDKHREWALKFFEGKVDFKNEEGRSSFVSRDVADTHGFILPGLLRVFFSSDRVGVYEPTRQHMREVMEVDEKTGQPRRVRKDVSEQMAAQATDYVNYVLTRECNGYRHIRDAFSDGLLLGNGLMKHWWDSSVEYSTEAFTGKNEIEYLSVVNGPDVEEVSDHEIYPDPNWVMPAEAQAILQMAETEPALVIPEDAIPQPPMLHDFKIKRVVSTGRLRISALPNEEFLIERHAKVLDETARFCAHVQRRTRSDLIKDGYDREKIDDLPAFQGSDDFDESDLREDDDWNDGDSAPDTSTELVDVFECYVLVDYDGDGIAERRKVVVAGHIGERGLLANDEWGDKLPFSDIVPEPRPHAYRGRSLYDEMADIQRVKTVVTRAMLDNTYQTIYPQKIARKDAIVASSWGEVVNPTWGGTIWVNDMAALNYVEAPNIVPQLAPVLEYMDQVGTRRTGASDRTQTLGLDALQNQTATAVNAVQSAIFAKTEEYARNIAEFGGLRRLFSCCLKLIVKNQDRPKQIRLRDEWVEMDPRAWDADMDVVINVGLGTGSRDRDAAMLQALRQSQKEYIAALGPFNEYVNIGNLLDTDRKLAEATGIRNAERFFPELSQDEIARIREEQSKRPPPPDPRIVALQQKTQLERQKATGDMQRKAMETRADIELQRTKAAANLQSERERNAMDLQAQREKNAMEIQGMRERTAAEIELDRQAQQADLALRREEMAYEAELTAQNNLLEAMKPSPNPDLNIRGPG